MIEKRDAHNYWWDGNEWIPVNLGALKFSKQVLQVPERASGFNYISDGELVVDTEQYCTFVIKHAELGTIGRGKYADKKKYLIEASDDGELWLPIIEFETTPSTIYDVWNATAYTDFVTHVVLKASGPSNCNNLDMIVYCSSVYSDAHWTRLGKFGPYFSTLVQTNPMQPDKLFIPNAIWTSRAEIFVHSMNISPFKRYRAICGNLLSENTAHTPCLWSVEAFVSKE